MYDKQQNESDTQTPYNFRIIIDKLSLIINIFTLP